jgi:hypothetical protein
LAACGLLKFFDFPLIRSQEFLLQYLIGMWSTDLQCFIVRGQQLTFSATEDVYFLTGLPFHGMALPIDPQLSGDERVGDLVARHCTGPNPMSGSVIQIEAIDDLLTECITAMVVRIYGSLGTQRITGGQLRIVERVLDGDLFSWGVLLHTKMMGQVNRCRRSDSGDFTFGSILVAWFLERVPLLHPRILARAHGATRVATDVVGPCVGPTWRWRGWPLFHDHGGTSVVTDATGDTEVSICGYGLPS